MKVSRSLPVIIPAVAGQRWSCHSCGDCCRTLVGHLYDRERRKLDEQQWVAELGVAPFVRVGRGWALNKRPDGTCVFLDESGLCRIHTKYGEGAKPLACRIFPFSVRPVRGGWQVSLRFDCPSVIASKGVPIRQHAGPLAELTAQLEHSAGKDDLILLQRRVRATPEEIDNLTGRLTRWLTDGDAPFVNRLIVAARLTYTLQSAKLGKVRGPQFIELLDLLLGALPAECATAPPAPTARQRGMLRQFAFACTEHVTLAERRAGMWRRCRKRAEQVRKAGRFLKGDGVVPRLPGFANDVTFAALESISGADEEVEEIENLLIRYLSARLAGRSVFGAGYYGWPLLHGLGALWLLAAAVGWLARYGAAVAGRTSVSLDDVAGALSMADRAATRLPALGTMTERARVSYLMGDDGLARLLWNYALAEHQS